MTFAPEGGGEQMCMAEWEKGGQCFVAVVALLGWSHYAEGMGRARINILFVKF